MCEYIKADRQTQRERDLTFHTPSFEYRSFHCASPNTLSVHRLQNLSIIKLVHE